MRKLFKHVLLSTFALVMLFNIGNLTPTAFAASDVAKTPCQPTQSILGFPTWYQYLDGEEVQGKCSPVIYTDNPDESSSLNALPIGLAIFDIAMTVAGLVAVVMVFVGSIRYILTLGEPARASSAQNTVINALVGLVIILIASRVVAFIAVRLS